MTETPSSSTEQQASSPGLTKFLLLGVLTSALGSVSTLVTSKVTAVSLGPEGMGVLAAILQVVTLGSNAAYLALSPALIAWIAQSRRDGDGDRLRRGLGSSVALCTLIVVAGETIVIAGVPFFLPSWSFDARPLVLAAALGTFASLVSAALRSALIGVADARAITTLALVSALANLVLLSGLTFAFGLVGRMVAMGLAGIVSLMAAATLVRRALGPGRWLRWDKTYLRQSLHVGIPFTFVSFLQLSVPFALRIALERGTNPAEATANVGQYQVALTVGQLYLALFTEGASNFVSSRYAAVRTPAELTSEVHAVGRFILRIMPPVVFTFIALRDYAVPILASSKFQAAAAILGWQVVGDIARLMAWSYIAVLPLRSKVAAHVFVELVGVALAIGLGTALVFRIGPIGAGIGYAITYFVQLGIAALVTSAVCEIRVAWKQLAVTWGLTVLAAGLLLAIRHVPFVRLVVLPGLIFWLWRSGAARSIGAKLGALRTALFARGSARSA